MKVIYENEVSREEWGFLTTVRCEIDLDRGWYLWRVTRRIFNRDHACDVSEEMATTRCVDFKGKTRSKSGALLACNEAFLRIIRNM